MSNGKFPYATLDGYIGPRFIDALEALHRELYRPDRTFCGLLVQQAAVRSGFTCAIERIITSDNYEWFWGMKISCAHGHLILALPWGQDRTRTDGTRSDRHSAIYMSKELASETVGDIIESLTRSLRLHFTPTRQKVAHLYLVK